MRHLILAAACLLTFSACSTYQYLTVDSSQLHKDQDHHLTLDNDTLRLSYDIDGKGGPVTVNIFNKTNRPLYVNWKKSAFIRNDHSTSLYNNDILLHGYPYSAKYAQQHPEAQTRTLVAALSIPEGTDFIPPASGISKILPSLDHTGLLQTDLSDTLTKKTILETDDFHMTSYKQQTFAEDQSPIKFKSYITFSLGDSTREFTETSSFYIAEACVSQARPHMFPLYRQEGDQLYIKQK